MIKIAVAEDNASLARAIAENIELNEDLELLFIAANGQDLLSLLEKQTPDVILMDISMPLMNGIEANTPCKGLVPAYSNNYAYGIRRQ